MKTILAAAILALSSLANAQAETLQGIAARCILDSVSPDAPNASAVRPPYHPAGGPVGWEVSWSDIEEAFYCPNIVDRANAEAARRAAEEKSRFDDDLRRYGEPMQ